MSFNRIIRALTPSILAPVAMALLTSQAVAQEFTWAPSLPIGSSLPPVSAQDQSGTVRTLQEVSGGKGLVLVMSRSFDWCPYCITQLRQLTTVADQFRAMGVNVAAMTYDPVATLAEAADEYEVDFPLLSDENVKHVNAMGILNTQYEPGHRAYGIPYPGIFLLDASGAIRYKFAEEDYRVRPDFSLVLEAAAKL